MSRETFDLEAVYDAEISPLMAQIIAICKAHRMPMLASFLYRDDDEQPEMHCTTNLPFDGRESKALSLAYQAVTQGFCAFTVRTKGGA